MKTSFLLAALVTIWPMPSRWDSAACRGALPSGSPTAIDCLAPRPIYFAGPENIDQWIHQYQELKRFIHKVHPGAEILITNKGEPPDEPGWEQIPFLWNGLSVWIRRHSVYDNIHDYYERLSA